MRKGLFIIIMGVLCLLSCTRPTPTPSAQIERELDAIYMADPDYYLDVLSSSDEICILNNLLENGASENDLRAAMEQVHKRIKNDKSKE